MKGSFKPVTRKTEIVIQELKGETLVYDLKSNKAFCLNETSSLVWRLCDGKRTVSEISYEMSRGSNSLISEGLIMLALNQFDNDGLLESDGALEKAFDGVSRREAIRKVGFASVVAMPAVSSIVAPKALMAQSMAPPPLANNSVCTAPGQCASGNCNGGVFNTSQSLGGTGLANSLCCASSSNGTVATGGQYCVTSVGACAATGFAACCSGSSVQVPTSQACINAVGSLNAGQCQCT